MSGQGTISPPKLKSGPSARNSSARASLLPIAVSATPSSSSICGERRSCGGLSKAMTAIQSSIECVRCGMKYSLIQERCSLNQVTAAESALPEAARVRLPTERSRAPRFPPAVCAVGPARTHCGQHVRLSTECSNGRGSAAEQFV
jgi:hypothetical protein